MSLHMDYSSQSAPKPDGFIQKEAAGLPSPKGGTISKAQVSFGFTFGFTNLKKKKNPDKQK